MSAMVMRVYESEKLCRNSSECIKIIGWVDNKFFIWYTLNDRQIFPAQYRKNRREAACFFRKDGEKYAAFCHREEGRKCHLQCNAGRKGAERGFCSCFSEHVRACFLQKEKAGRDCLHRGGSGCGFTALTCRRMDTRGFFKKFVRVWHSYYRSAFAAENQWTVGK